MRGHIRKRGKRWAAVVYLSGRYKWFSGFATRKQAQQKLTEVLKELDQGTYIEPSKQTLEEYLSEWLTGVEHSLRSNTFGSYEHLIRLYVIPRLGTRKLAQLTPQALNALYGQLLEGGGKNGRPLSRKTVRAVHLVLNRALGDAARWGLMPRNPAALAASPRPAKREIRTWTPEQVRSFLEYVRSSKLTASRHYTAYLLAVSTGMRRSEILGLRWRDVDFDRATLSVQQVACAYGSKRSLTYSDPKTAMSRRQIALDLPTVAALRDHRKKHMHVQSELVFTEPDGSPTSPTNFSQRFLDAVRRSELPRIRFHDLRHTHATIALAAGVHPKVVQERLGHSDISVTLGIYSHVVEGMQEEAAQAIGAALWERGR